jgi:hypothetical protein
MSYSLSAEDRIHLSRVILDVLEQWRVSVEQQVTLLGLQDDGGGETLAEMRGGSPYPDDEALLDRAQHILAIHDCLRTAYPRSTNMAVYWLNQPNRHFRRQPPLQVMLQADGGGLEWVRGHLDCTRNWID